MSSNSREAILAAARKAAQAHGYNGLNFRDLATEVGIKAASIYHHFPSKTDLGVALARRYWEDAAADLDAMLESNADPLACLRWYPVTFRRALEQDNRMCLCSFMASEVDDLPPQIRTEVLRFTDVNVAWLSKVLIAAGVVQPAQAQQRAYAIFAAISGAQLAARGRGDISLYDAIVEGCRSSGLLPG
ncbi:TetR family transcriptional regulator [Bordetella genomosp. 8]|uniref:TetR family transcriptional regulator n=1 Tax=Bordetella genomosp. 8 TaxID=1416806 RepID=A0A1W6YSS3_9BORD|nr:TetR/AcrR family transcriptional regulator [Bordetella genomosp. 8]ARP84142.1 TetR family transcriptional regulator [Bordetella genomosp. 8]